jgi:hypothetical protein
VRRLRSTIVKSLLAEQTFALKGHRDRSEPGQLPSARNSEERLASVIARYSDY